MHIVFIVGSYYPNYSAVGKCVGNVANVLEKSHKVTIICAKNSLDEKYEETLGQQRILRVLTKDKKLRSEIENKINREKSVKSKLYNFIYKIYKSSKVLKLILSKDSLKKELILKYFDELRKIEEPIDIIIPASMPFESVVAAVKYKKTYKKEIKVIPYLFDHFVENENLHRIKLNKKAKSKSNYAIEQDTIRESDKVLILKQLEDYYIQNYKEYKDKFTVVEHPLLTPPNFKGEIKEPKMKFIYAGSFYKNIRTPDYMLRVVDNVLKEVNGVLNLYTFGNCNEVINKFTTNNRYFINHGKVSTENVYKELSNHKFLVAVGNKDNKQVPSKIFEYISYGKPIIYFYSNSHDVNLDVLSKYKLAICIKEDWNSIEKNTEKLLRYCIKNVNKHIPYSEVDTQFKDATPSYTANIIEEMIRE